MFLYNVLFSIFTFQVGIASKTLGGGGNQMLPLPEKALSESMEKGGRKMQGKKEKMMIKIECFCVNE